jgi:acetyl-CoA synthase
MRWCQKSVEVRGLKVPRFRNRHSLRLRSGFEGERVRGDDLYAQMGGGKTQCTELVQNGRDERDRRRQGEVIGPDIGDVKEGDNLPLGIFMSRWPAVKCSPISSPSWNVRFII